MSSTPRDTPQTTGDEPKTPSVRCYYDADCGFCTRTVERLRRLARLPAESIIPAQTDPEIMAIMERENSWVVIDQDGNQLLRWRALSAVIRLRKPLRPIAALMMAPGIAWIGDRLYRWIANHRGSF